MSRYAHKTKTKRKIITLEEWGTVVGLSRQTIARQLQKYTAGGKNYNPGDILDVLSFHRYLIQRTP